MSDWITHAHAAEGFCFHSLTGILHVWQAIKRMERKELVSFPFPDGNSSCLTLTSDWARGVTLSFPFPDGNSSCLTCYRCRSRKSSDGDVSIPWREFFMSDLRDTSAASGFPISFHSLTGILHVWPHTDDTYTLDGYLFPFPDGNSSCLTWISQPKHR